MRGAKPQSILRRDGPLSNEEDRGLEFFPSPSQFFRNMPVDDTSAGAHFGFATHVFHALSSRSSFKPAASSACSVVFFSTFSSGLKPARNSESFAVPGPYASR